MTEAFAIVDPSTGEAFTEVGMAGAREVDEAVRRAVRAQEGWAALAPADRARLLRRFAAVVDAHAEELARLEVRNSGHPILSARWEAGHVRDVLEYYSAAPERLIGAQIPVAGGIDVTFHEPLGVVGVIVPWNFPMTIAAWGFAPALAAGNAVVLKPAEWTPLTAIRLAALALEAGLPDGLLQTVPGRGAEAGEALVRHPDVRQGRVHGLDPHRLPRDGARRGAGEARHAGARREEREHRLRRRGPGCRRGRGTRRRVRQRRAGLLRAQPHARRAPGARRLPRAPRARRRRVAGRRPARGGRADGPARQRGAPRPRRLLPRRLHAGRPPRHGPRRTRLLVRAGGAPARPPRRPGAHRRDLRPRRRGAGVRRGGGGGAPRERDRLRAVRLDLDPRPRPRHPRLPRRAGRGAVSVNSNSSVRYTTPFGGMKRSGIGRELGPDAPLAFTAAKNVYYATEETPQE